MRPASRGKRVILRNSLREKIDGLGKSDPVRGGMVSQLQLSVSVNWKKEKSDQALALTPNTIYLRALYSRGPAASTYNPIGSW